MTTAVSPSVGKGKNKTYDPYALRKSAKTPWGNPVVYFFSLLLVALCVGPVLYIIIGGFRTNAQITRDPAGWPDPWNCWPPKSPTPSFMAAWMPRARRCCAR